MKCVSLGRGMRVCGRDSMPENIFLPRSRFIQLSRHLLWGGPWTCSNFYVLLSESKKAMFFDYGHAYWPHMHIWADHDGFETMRFVEHHLDELSEEHSVEEIDLVLATHIHDDHTCGIPYLQRHHGTAGRWRKSRRSSRTLRPGRVHPVFSRSQSESTVASKTGNSFSGRSMSWRSSSLRDRQSSTLSCRSWWMAKKWPLPETTTLSRKSSRLETLHCVRFRRPFFETAFNFICTAGVQRS